MTPRRCIVADDHPALLHAVASFLEESGFEVVARAADTERALELAVATGPEVALVDYRMPGGGGADLVRRLKERAPSTAVIVYTADADEKVLADVFGAGAQGIVLKEAPLADLERALTAVLAGGTYVDAALISSALIHPAGGRSSVLTERELDVLRLVADGLSHSDIGKRLGISPETARTHLRKACDRLGVETRTAAVAKALRLGVIA